MADILRLNRDVAVAVVYPPQLRAETGQAGLCVSIPWLLNMRAIEAAKYEKIDLAKHLDAEAALYPGNPNTDPSWALEWTPDPERAANRIKGLEQAEAILSDGGGDHFIAARAWLAWFAWLTNGEAEGELWNEQLSVDYKAVEVDQNEGIVTAIGSVMHALADHYDGEAPERASELRLIADKYYLDGDLEVSVTTNDGTEHGLYEFEWIGPTEAQRLKSLHAKTAVEIPGTIEFRQYTELSRQSDDANEQLPFRGFLYQDLADDDDDRIRCVIWNGESGFSGFDDIDPALLIEPSSTFAS